MQDEMGWEPAGPAWLWQPGFPRGLREKREEEEGGAGEQVGQEA